MDFYKTNCKRALGTQSGAHEMENTLKTAVGFEEGLKGRPRYVLCSQPQYSNLHKENETHFHQNKGGWLLKVTDCIFMGGD